MTEKQIYDRLRRCYLNCMVKSPEQLQTDEWYSADDIRDWKWHRLGEDKYYHLHLNPDGTVTCSEKNFENDAYHIVDTFSSKEYMHKPDPDLDKECADYYVDDEPEL